MWRVWRVCVCLRVLRCVVRCCALLCYVVLCCAVLSCAVRVYETRQHGWEAAQSRSPRFVFPTRLCFTLHRLTTTRKLITPSASGPQARFQVDQMVVCRLFCTYSLLCMCGWWCSIVLCMLRGCHAWGRFRLVSSMPTRQHPSSVGHALSHFLLPLPSAKNPAGMTPVFAPSFCHRWTSS